MARLSLLFVVLALATHAAFGAPPCDYNTTVTDFTFQGMLGGNGHSKASHGHSITHTTPAASTPSDPASSNTNSTGGSGSVPSSDQQAYLDDHNNFRQLHGANPLTWSAELASAAQAWADKCVFEHSGTSGVGENIATGSGDMSISSAITMWTDESSSYTPDNPGNSLHFTQVVWKATTQLGCASATCAATDGSSTLYVCQYDPQGNVDGEYSQNVQV